MKPNSEIRITRCPCRNPLSYEEKVEAENGLADHCRCELGVCPALDPGGECEVPWVAIGRALADALRCGVRVRVPELPVPRSLLNEVVVATELGDEYAALGDEVGRVEYVAARVDALAAVKRAEAGWVPFMGWVDGELVGQLRGDVWERSCCAEVVAGSGPLRVSRLASVASEGARWSVELLVPARVGVAMVGPVLVEESTITEPVEGAGLVRGSVEVVVIRRGIG